MTKILIDREDLYRRYVLEVKNTTELAILYGCSNTTVSKYLKEYKIQLRTPSERKTGKLNPSYGKPSPQRGRKRTCEQIKNIKSSLPRGENHFRYKKPENRIEHINNQIRNCQRSKDWKRAVLIRDNFICQMCKQSKSGKLEIDHIVTFAEIKRKYNITSLEEALCCEDFWNPLNGRTLCHDCHLTTDTYGYKNLQEIK